MRRLSIAVLAGVLLAGLVAAPAAADRDIEHGNIPHYSFTWAFAYAAELQPEVREVPTGEWVEFGGGWATWTEEQRGHFVETAIVEIGHDGVFQEVSPFLLEVDGDWPFRAFFGVLIEPGRAKAPQVWTMRITFTEDHFDGEDWYPAGTVDDGTRIIVWTPRGQFPSGDYPPSFF